MRSAIPILSTSRADRKSDAQDHNGDCRLLAVRHASYNRSITGTELVSLVLVGVLLPTVFSRPLFLAERPMAEHKRRRWNFVYSLGVFAVMGYVYIAARYLLRPVHDFTPAAQRALAMGALILFFIACAHHLPPLFTDATSRLAVFIQVVAVALLGLMWGGFVAINEVFAHTKHPLVANLSWAALLLLTSVSMFWFSGFSPETRLGLYRLKKKRRLRRRRKAAGS